MKKSKYIVPLIIFFVIFGGLLFGVNNEYFQDYMMYPYGEVYSGSDPLYFYNYNRYRKPYRYPLTYYSSYAL